MGMEGISNITNIDSRKKGRATRERKTALPSVENPTADPDKVVKIEKVLKNAPKDSGNRIPDEIRSDGEMTPDDAKVLEDRMVANVHQYMSDSEPPKSADIVVLDTSPSKPAKRRPKRQRTESKVVPMTPRASKEKSPDEAEKEKFAEVHEKALRRAKDPEGELKKENEALGIKTSVASESAQEAGIDHEHTKEDVQRAIDASGRFSFDDSIFTVKPERAISCIKNLEHALIDAEYGWAIQSKLMTKSIHVSIHETAPDTTDSYSITRTEGGPATVKLDISISENLEEMTETVDNVGKEVTLGANSEKGNALRVNVLTDYLEDRFKVNIHSRLNRKDSRVAEFLENVHGGIRSLSYDEQAQLGKLDIIIPENNGFPTAGFFKAIGWVPYTATTDYDGNFCTDLDTPTEKIAEGLRKFIAMRSSQK